MVKRLVVLSIAAMLCLLLSGCFSVAAEDLLALPKQPSDSIKLYEQIDKQLASGAQLLSPVGGVNRQTIQMVDMDGDGEDEAVVFFRTRGEKPLSIFVFRKQGEAYEQIARIDGDGESIDSIAYENLIPGGMLEIVVVWRVGQGAVKAISAHILEKDGVHTLLSTSCNAHTLMDFSGDGVSELLILRRDDDTLENVAELYTFDGLEAFVLSRAPLSANIEAIQRVRNAYLSDGLPAVMVTSQYDTSAVLTDIVCLKDGQLRNVTLDEESGVSQKTVRRYAQPAITDIDRDGVLDIPYPFDLPAYGDSADSQDSVWLLINWRAFDSGGDSFDVTTTYHNYADNWYFEVPAPWLSGLTMTRLVVSAGERGVVFAETSTGPTPRDLLIIYTLTGDDREELSQKPGRFLLLIQSDTIVAAEILPSATGVFAISEGELKNRVSWIERDWILGELNL